MDGVGLPDCTVLAEADKALLIDIPDANDEVWVPKSAIHDDSEVFDNGDNGEGMLVVKAWFARQQGWE